MHDSLEQLLIMDLAALPGVPSSCVVAALYQADGRVETPLTILLVSRAAEVGRAVQTLTDVRR